MKKIEVVAAIIYFEDKILCVQRAKNKLSYISEKYEFPGGKIEKGETNEDALLRELLEELNMVAEIQSLFLSVKHQYPDFELTMHSYLCKVNSQQIILKEHIAFNWLLVDELEKLDWVAADLPIVKKLVTKVRL